MSSPTERLSLLGFIEQACNDGARLAAACAAIGLSARTVQRWQQPAQVADRRVADQRRYVCPHNKLSAEERQSLDWAIRYVQGMSFTELKTATHDSAYNKTPKNQPIAWQDIIASISGKA